MKILNTERLTLSKITLKDAGFLLELMNDKDWIQNIGDRGVYSLEDAENYIKERFFKSYEVYGFGFYVIRLQSSGKAIGTAGLIDREGIEGVEIGYGLLPAYRGKGYAYEAAEAVYDYAKNVLNIAKIVAIVAPNNTKSIFLLERLGLHYEKMVTLPGEEKEIKYFS
jgi:RimJ/RimL family protein N-acetyltransferase